MNLNLQWETTTGAGHGFLFFDENLRRGELHGLAYIKHQGSSLVTSQDDSAGHVGRDLAPIMPPARLTIPPIIGMVFRGSGQRRWCLENACYCEVLIACIWELLDAGTTHQAGCFLISFQWQ